ncbi:MAG: hypothetical protein JNJ83_11015 [Verrucomicrobiaceae bacterium]|nr:hypothetical protein [Verrucomicrobiaceae bacterium]
MAAIDTNPDLLLRAFVETARDLFPSPADPKPWLKQLRNAALTGSTTVIGDVLSNLQDWGASAVANAGSSTQWMRELSAVVVAQLAQAALDIIVADEDAGGVGLAAPGNVRFADFSTQPCVLG